jgi:hypothetical protein
MLIELKKLNIINEGYKRKIFLDRIYINSAHVVSIKDYEGVRKFLLSEGIQDHITDSFSLVKVNSGREVEEIIVLGKSQDLFKSFSSAPPKKRILND